MISGNGQRGSRGATTGFNGVEILSGWHGPSMVIDANTIAGNTGNGVLVGSGAVRVTNNAFNDNWLAMTIFNAPGIAANVTIEGNTFDTQPLGGRRQPHGAHRWLYDRSAEHFQELPEPPAIACELGTAVTTCPLSRNQFVNSALAVSRCQCTP